MNPNDYMSRALATEADQQVIHTRRQSLGVQATRLDNGVRGLTDEVGELASVAKKHLEYGKPLDRNNVLEECGDALWRICQILAATGFSLEEAMRANISKLQKVRYKDGYSDAAADPDGRDLEAERKAVEDSNYKTHLDNSFLQG